MNPKTGQRWSCQVSRRMAGITRTRLWAALVAAGLFGAAVPVQAWPIAAAERWLVWAREGVTEGDLGRGLSPYRVSRQRLGRDGWHVLTVPGGPQSAPMRQRLSQHPLFKQVEPDRLHPLSQAFNDPFAGSSWHLERVAMQPAWTVARGMGKGVTVAVLDTGVQADHPDLQGVLVPGWNVVDRSPNTTDFHGHGTSVVGLLAAQINNGQGVVGMAPGARILPIRVTQPDGNARTSDIAMGMQQAAERGARIVNISFEGVMGSSAIRSAAQALSRQGVLVVAASGNRGEQELHAQQPGLMMVGAVDEWDRRPPWASYGAYLALAAPGEGLWTTGLGGGYRVVWGTSFATPLVSAVAALMWEAAPDATPDQLEQWLKESAVDLGEPGPDVQFGHGRLNAAAAVTVAQRWQAARSMTLDRPEADGASAVMPGAVRPTTGWSRLRSTGSAVMRR